MLEMIKMIQEAEDFAALGAASKEKISRCRKRDAVNFFCLDYKEY